MSIGVFGIGAEGIGAEPLIVIAPAVAFALAAVAPAIAAGAVVAAPAAAIALAVAAPASATGAIVAVPVVALSLAPVVPRVSAIDLHHPGVVYACEIVAALRAWQATDVTFGAIGGQGIGAGPEIERTNSDDPLYAATRAFGTTALDDPANTRFHGRLKSFSFRRTMLGGEDFAGIVQGDGELTIDNGDGQYDERMFQSIGGAMITVKVGRPGILWSDWMTILSGTARSWTFDEEAVHVQIRDDSFRLGVMMQDTLYAGTGGAEGGEALKDKRKPLLLGYRLNISPPQVDPAQLIHQIHDGAIDTVFTVRDRGVPLTFGADRANYAALVAAAPAAGHYDTCLAEGFIKLGSTPAGTVTADAATYRSSGAATLATVVRGILEDRGDITSFDEASFTALAAAYPGDHGLWLSENDNSTVAETVAKLMSGVMGFSGFRRDGRCAVAVVGGFDGGAAYAFSKGSVLEISLDRLPAGLSPPPWRVRLTYAGNDTVQTDLAGSADQVWAQPGKVTSAQDSGVKLDQPLAQDRAPRDSLMNDATLAEAEASRQLIIVKEERPMRRTLLPRPALTAEIGDLIEVGYDRLGGRRRGLNVEDNVEVGDGVDTVELVLYG